MKNNDNLKNFFNLCDPTRIIESFNIADDCMFVNANSEYMYKLKTTKCIDYLKTNMNIIDYINSKSLPYKIKKVNFNDHQKSLGSYKDREVLNRVSGIKY